MALSCIDYIPKEKFYAITPEVLYQDFPQWRLDLACIRSAGKNMAVQDINHQQLIRRLRNAVAHCRVEPFPNDHRPLKVFTFVMKTDSKR